MWYPIDSYHWKSYSCLYACYYASRLHWEKSQENICRKTKWDKVCPFLKNWDFSQKLAIIRRFEKKMFILRKIQILEKGTDFSHFRFLQILWQQFVVGSPHPLSSLTSKPNNCLFHSHTPSRFSLNKAT